MKTTHQLLSIVGLIAAMLFPIVGCQTPPDRVALVAAGTVVIGVDGAMKAWHDQVIAGHATQDQVDAVKSLYTQYYNASLVEKQAFLTYEANKNDATLSGWQQAVKVATSLETSLLNLLVTYIPNLKIK